MFQFFNGQTAIVCSLLVFYIFSPCKILRIVFLLGE